MAGALALSAPVAGAIPAQAGTAARAAALAVPAAAPGLAAAPAKPDHTVARRAVPSPRPEEWWFPPWSIEQKIWPVAQGQGITVAVVDSGVNAARPELAGAVVPGGDTSGHGTDGRKDFDKGGHGTSMSVLIAGQGGGRTGLVGIAPRARILPVDVQPAGASSLDDAALTQGIRFAVDHGARVINISLAGPTTSGCPPTVMDAVAYAVHRDVVVVAGAGNSAQDGNPVMYPATCPGVLAVGATDDHSRPWVKSEGQDYVSVAAPGVNIPVSGKDESYYFPHSDGTSSASALVSAAAALVRSANPRMPAREVVDRLIGTALDVSTPGKDDQTGYGIIRIARAMNPAAYPLPAGSPNPPYERFDQWEHPDRAIPASPSPSSASPGGSASSGKSSSASELVPLIVGLVVVALIVVALIARRGGRGGGRPDEPGPAGPPRSSGPPPGFGKDARPTSEPPDDRP